MDQRWAFILFALTLDGLVGLTGGLLPERWVRRSLGHLVGFAAGALLGAVFLDILPEATEAAGAPAFGWALAGFLLLAFVEWIIRSRRRGPEARPVLPVALLFSDALHNTGDGVAITAAFLSSPGTGVAVALAVIAHELPEEIGDYALLRSSGWSRRESLLALMGVQLTAFVGALGVFLLQSLVVQSTALLLAVSGGSFLYIGAVDLIPELRPGPGASPWPGLLSLTAGLVVVATTHLVI